MPETFYPAREVPIVLTPHSFGEAAGIDCVANAYAYSKMLPGAKVMVGGFLAKSIHPDDGPPAIWNTPWPWHVWLIDKDGAVKDPSIANLAHWKQQTGMSLPVEPWDIRAVNLPFTSPKGQHEAINRHLFDEAMRDVDYEVAYVPGQPAYLCLDDEADAPLDIQMMGQLAVSAAEEGGLAPELFRELMTAMVQTLQENDPSRVTATWMRLKGQKRSARRSSFLRTVSKL